MSKLLSIFLAVVTALNLFGGFGAKADIAPAYPDGAYPGASTDAGSSEDTGDQAASDTPMVEDVSAIQAEVDAFLDRPGVNGFICGGGNWPEERVRLSEIVYQVTDEAYTYDEVVAAYEAEIGEVHTDITYISASELDWLLWEITGYDLYDPDTGAVQDCWNTAGLSYIEELDLYCVQHGDTNYQGLRAQVMEYDEGDATAYVRLYSSMEDMDLYCYIADSFTPCRYIDLVLWHWDTDLFEIRSIQPYVR